jgi:hypothetical protein
MTDHGPAPAWAVTVRNRRLAAAGLVAAVVLAAIVALGGGGSGHRRLVPGGGGAAGTFDPLAYSGDRTNAMVGAATDGLSHVIYAKSPGGVVASAKRTAALRPAVEAAAAHGSIGADTLEAIIMLESAGRPDVVAGPDPSAAAGATQIVAETGTSLLGMHIDLGASRKLAGQIARASARGNAALVARLSARRAQVDQRFDPARALAATERYLAIARQRFGRDDLAVESYHMGIGNLESVLRLYAGAGAGDPVAKLVSDNGLTYPQLYFDSTPLHHGTAYALLSRFGDDSATYYWRILAAEQVMHLYRTDLAQLARLSALHGTGASAEHVLRPPGTPAFADATAIATARSTGALLAVPGGAGAAQAQTLGLRPEGALLLRPDALAVAEYLAAGVREIAHSRAPLALVAATTAASSLTASADRDPLLATGYAFDIARHYASPAQAQAFQFMLDRLQTLNLIAYQRQGASLHVVTGPAASSLLSLLRSSGGAP